MNPSSTTAGARPAGALRDFLVLPFRARATMTRILERPRDRAVLPLLLLAIISAALADAAELNALEELDATIQFTVAGIVLLVLLLTIGAFYLYSWLVAAITGVLGGVATARSTRSALAWALIPSIWALAYRVPVAFSGIVQRQDVAIAEGITIPGAGVESCGVAAALGLLELAVLVWVLVLAVVNLSVAARVSIGRSVTALVLTLVIPISLLLVSLPLLG